MTVFCHAQFASPEQAALKNIRKKKWAKAEQLLRKSLAKDSLNAAGRHLLSVLYFNDQNPSYNIDSAYDHAAAAVRLFQKSSPRERTRLGRIPLDSISLVNQRIAVERAAFQRAMAIDTEGAWLQFLSDFPFAQQREEAIMLRDEAAYNLAVKTNTYEAYLTFLTKYPRALRAREARDRYERLLYEARTQDRTLRSYELFLMEYPATPYRREAEKHILGIMTASGEPAAFQSFISKYQRSSYRKIAEDLLYHITVNTEAENFQTSPGFSWPDSLQQVMKRDQDFLVPVLKDDRFGFMNREGLIVMPVVFSDISEDYKCGNVTDDVMLINGNLIDRSGHAILVDSVSAVEDIGIGFLKVTAKGFVHVYHKSGSIIQHDVEDAKIIGDRFIAVKRSGRWNLSSLTGLLLTVEGFDDIFSLSSVVAFKANERIRLSTPLLIGDVANGFDLKMAGPYDQVKVTGDFLHVRVSGLQGLVDKNLQLVLPLGEEDIEKTVFGFVARARDHVTLYDQNSKSLGAFDSFRASAGWVAVKTDSIMRFLDVRTGHMDNVGYDSITFAGPYPVTYTKDSVAIFFDAARKLFKPGSSVSYLPRKDSTGFMIVRENGKRAVFDHGGKLLFTGDYEQIDYGGDGYFIVHRRERKGLVNKHGKVVLPLDYEAIGAVNRGVVSVLKSTRFGAYNIRLKKLMKPAYDKNIIVYNEKVLAVYQKGQYVFVDWSGKPLEKNSYDEIRSWNDSIAIVRTGFNWKFHDIAAGRDLIEPVKKINFVTETSLEKLAVIRNDHHYGVVSNTRGVIIPPTFSYIVNVGSSEHPVYFTEKHVEEASIYVVIWYDETGKLLRREVYEEDDYERIFCSDH